MLISQFKVCFFLALCLLIFHEGETQLPPDTGRCVTVIVDPTTMKLTFVDGLDENKTSVAWGNFTLDQRNTGWNYLSISTNPVYNDSFQAYAAGLVEGFLTADYIYVNWVNTLQSFCNVITPDCQNVKEFLLKNVDWMRKTITENPDDPYFYQMGLTLDQVSGLKDGYDRQPNKPSIDIDPFGFLLFQAGADIQDIETALKANKTEPRPSIGGHCSALIKLLPGNKDIFFSHDTWTEYSQMLRIIKKYNLAFRQSKTSSAFIPGREVSFSSYPGSIFSGDDFYIMGSGLVTMETTIGNDNLQLWKHVNSTGTVLEWMRNILANRLANTVSEWTSIFSQYNSGTYNNEWMVVDYKLFNPGQPLPKEGVLAVLDQLPGLIVKEDLTWLLSKQTYFASYNVPFFPAIYQEGGFAKQAEEYGPWFSYNETSRALIFKRDHGKVSDMDSMIHLMRYNDFQHDPLSHCNCTPPYSGENAISARSDLNLINGTYPYSPLSFRCHGGIDMKATSSKMSKTLSMMAVNGPTHDQQPPFQWSKSECDKRMMHIGQPDLFNFDPVEINWK